MKHTKRLSALLLIFALSLGCNSIGAAAAPAATHLEVDWNGTYTIDQTLSPAFNLSDLIVTVHFEDDTANVLPHWTERSGTEPYWTYSFDKQSNTMYFSLNGRERLASIDFPADYILAYIEEHQQPVEPLALDEATPIGDFQVFRFTAPESREYRIESASYATLSLAIVTDEGEVVQYYVFGWTGEMEEGETYYIFVWDDHDMEKSFTIRAVPPPTWLEQFFRSSFGMKLYNITLGPLDGAFNATMLLVGMSFGMFLPAAPFIFLGSLILGYVYGFIGLFQ